jgi:EAL domain-containing protein (putative c-di-GMP-specific phosphodiesterase class I)
MAQTYNKSVVTMFFQNDGTNQINEIETLYIIDILYMKDINALYGFENGNKVINYVYTLLQSRIYSNIKSILKKIQKDDTKIAIINPYIDIYMLKISTNLHHIYIKKIADMILNEIASSSIYLGSLNININIDVTIGCSKYGSEQIVVFAERAVQLAKINHQHFTYFDPRFFKNEITNNSFIDLLKSNISQNTITPYFQAIVNNKDDSIEKYEALMRIVDLNGNILNPGSFLTKSKKYRLYPKLMSIMIEKVLNIVKEHKIHVSINFEFNDILNPLLKSLLISQMAAYGIGRYITIEILESEKIEDFNIVREFISEIKTHGAQVAIDDFGSGFSNYEHILELDIDYIKLDGSLVQKIDEGVYNHLIESIVSFCQNESIKVIAEFVKDLKILRYVKSLNIDCSQGFYLAVPTTIETILGDKTNDK